MMAAGAEQHNTRCALLGGEGGSDCILHDICTLYGHQSMHSMLGRDHHYYYTPHSAAIRCDGVMVSPQMVTFALTRDTRR